MKGKGLTLLEALIVTVISALTVALTFSIRAERERRETYSDIRACQRNLKDFALACKAYSSDYGGYWPRLANPKYRALASLDLLYQGYSPSAESGRCPAGLKAWRRMPVEDNTGLYDSTTSYVYVPREPVRLSARMGDYIVTYVYDPLARPGAAPGKAMIADDCGGNPGRPAFAKDSNHEFGANVLFFDAHVEWVNTKINSYTGDQNIYSSADWNEHSASYLRK